MKDLIKSFPELQYQLRVAVLNEYFIWLLFMGIFTVFLDIPAGFLFLGVLFVIRSAFQWQLEKHLKRNQT